MPPLPWPKSIDEWNPISHAFLSRNRKSSPVFPPWSPPTNAGCRHPDDHVIIRPPRLPVQIDGGCFLHSTPTFFRPRVGHVDGIGTARTVGYVHLPLYIDCMSQVGGKTGKVELNLEVHLVEDLPVDLIVGMDAICAYGIDTIVSHSLVYLNVRGPMNSETQLACPIEFRRSKGLRDPACQDSFSVICGDGVIIHPLHEASVRVITGLTSIRGDAWLHPVHVKHDNRLLSPLDG